MRNAEQHAARPRETGDVVDMAVGLVIRESVAQPDHLADAGIERERFLDLLLREIGIAVRVQQSLLGGEQGALAVHMDRAAFAHQRRAIDLQALTLQHAAGEFRVVREGKIFVAPGVELPLHAGARAIRPTQHGGAAVARPRVIDDNFEDFRFPGAGEFHFRKILRPRGDRHRLERCDGARHPRIGLLGAQQTFRPAPCLDTAGPRHPGALMRIPFGGHGKAVARGTGIVSIHAAV